MSISSQTLNVTALATLEGKTIFQCWTLQPAFTTSAQSGTIGAEILPLGDLANATYLIIPARYNGGPHNSPYVQWAVYLSGLAHITLPEASLPISNDTNYTTDAWFAGGTYGTIFLADTEAASSFGHITEYPSDEETRALQIPTAGGLIPNHTVLSATGPCTEQQLVGRKRAFIEQLD